MDLRYRDAIYWYVQAAKQGHDKAQCTLGNIYYQGKIVSKNLNNAILLYTNAAQKGNVEAQFNLGNMYAKGEAKVKKCL